LARARRAAQHPCGRRPLSVPDEESRLAAADPAAEGLDRDELAKLFDKRLARTSPQRAAQVILDAVRKKKARVLVGTDAKVMDLMVRLAGPYYQQLFGPVMGRLMPKP